MNTVRDNPSVFANPATVRLSKRRTLREIIVSWKDWILASADRQRDAYLSGAVDRIDLEQRIRKLERRPTAFRDGV